MAGIRIPVEAQVNTGDLQQATQQFVQQFNKLGAVIAQANKIKFDPISKATIDDLSKIEKQFDSLRKISGALNNRMKATGQTGAGFFDVDWGRMYSDSGARAREMRKAFEYVTGYAFGGATIPSAGSAQRPSASSGQQPQRPPAPTPGVHWAAAGRGVVSAGLRATGGAGAAADGALSAGMAGGAMAGLAGLVGGIVALGVGKAVGAVMNRVGDAEQERVSIDTLKRTLGDVNVGFHTLKESLRATANDLQIPINEAGRLGTEFAKIADLGPEAYKTLATEVDIAGGFGRSFGMDPATSNAFFAQMRQMRVTETDRDSRRLSLMIGEAVAKSGSFAKADEVLQAIGNFAAQQTRLGLTRANTEGYTAFLAGMVGSGKPGTDPKGSAAIVGKANEAVQQGGAAGEAGQQFLYSAVGAPLGLNPVQARVQLEQGLFGSAASTFRRGGVYDQYAQAFGGQTPATGGPIGPKTTIELIMGRLQAMYRGRPDLMANAAANLLGLNHSQAMAFLTQAKLGSGRLGGIHDRLTRLGVNLGEVNASGVAALGQIEVGDRSVLEAQAHSLFGRSGSGALSSDERDRLRTALAGGDDEKLRDVLAELTATRSQEATEGTRIRQSIVDLQNALQRAADRLVDPLVDIRAGILFMAGGKGEMGPMGIKLAVARAESRERLDSINARVDPEIAAAREREVRAKAASAKLRNEKLSMGMVGQWSGLPADERARIDSEIARLQKEEADAQANRANLERQKAAQISSEEARLKAEQDGIRASFANTPATGGSFAQDAESEGLTETEQMLAQAVYGQESGGGANTATSINGAVGHMQMLPSTFAAFADPGWDINNPEHNRRAGMRYLKYLLKKSGGNVRTAAGAYYGGEKAIGPDGALKEYSNLKRPSDPTTLEYADQVMARMRSMGYDTPVPVGAQGVDSQSGSGQPQRVAL